MKPIIKKILFFPALLFIFFCTVSFHDHKVIASDGSSAFDPHSINVKHILSQAISIHFTPRGLRYFDSNLIDLTDNAGISLDDIYIPKSQTPYITPVSYPITDLTQDRAIKKILKEIRNQVSDWLIGLNINTFRPAISWGDIQISTNIKMLSLSPDLEWLKRLNPADGAILVLKIGIENLHLDVDFINALNLDAKNWGKIGLENFIVQLQSTSASKLGSLLTIHIPFYVRIKTTGELQFQVLDVQENITSASADMSFSKIIFPELNVNINGQIFPFNTASLYSILNQNSKSILSNLLRKISEIAHHDLPQYLNAKVRAHWNKMPKMVSPIQPPGGPAKAPPFLWGAQFLDNCTERSHLFA